MPNPVIRHAALSDLDALVALEEATFDSDRISHRQWRRHLSSASAQVLVAVGDAGIDAAAVVFYRRNSHIARLYSLAVDARARGNGIGGRLLVAAETTARQRGCAVLRLEVRVDNTAALALYARHGYARLRRLVGFYEDGSDAWRCAKDLTTITP